MKKENTTIKLFEKYADRYDKMQTAVVPHYEEIVSTVATAYQHYIKEGVFLDLGCGTGNISLAILKNSPRSKAFLLDGSPSMLKIAKNKIQKQFGSNHIIGSKTINLEDQKWHEGINKPLDAVVAAFVLEHLKEPDYKNVIKICHGRLKPGGVFISFELSDNEYGMREWFLAEMKKRGERHSEYKDIIEEGIKLEKHYFVNINKKLGWIRQAGYKNVHTIWQNLFCYIVVGEK